jgi:hypothetical protein
VAVAVLEAADIIGRRHIDEFRIVQLGLALADHRKIPLDVVALRFGEPCRTDRDDLRRSTLADVQQCRLDVLVAAEYRRHLVHRRRLQRNRFLEVPHQQHETE